MHPAALLGLGRVAAIRAFLQVFCPTRAEQLPPSLILLASYYLEDLPVRFDVASEGLDLGQYLHGFDWLPCVNVALQLPNQAAKVSRLKPVQDDSTKAGKSSFQMHCVCSSHK
jgi:hypothetical protein